MPGVVVEGGERIGRGDAALDMETAQPHTLFFAGPKVRGPPTVGSSVPRSGRPLLGAILGALPAARALL